MTIGELLKNYRIGQKKTQKEWAGDVISSSFYAKVEKNLSRISADDLVNLLYANKIPLIAFFGKLNQQEQSIHNQEQEIIRLANEAYYQNSLKDLQQIRNVIKKSDFPDKDDKLLFVDIYIALVSGNKLDTETVKKVKDRIFSVPDFNVDTLTLYCDFMEFYDLDSNLVISKRVIKQFLGSSSKEVQELLLTIITNMMILCIQNNKFEEADFFINSEQQIRTNPDLFFRKMIAPAFADIIKYHYDHNQKHLDEVETIVKGVQIAGMPSYAKDIEELMNANK
ncbi:hypothetical protein PT285_00170 [Lactobacillus sp. ESL0791]|uniref:helix-turn-helix domain-containing protein n=1 Tax=Lactobacillus sp. ESL0791 TaxID=2983234 RepID=UPI0023F92498|nr:hypothetical protein [Lactobacillus sp. ESL0791]MDF7637859.1 hypothetical protein [Lactobacillus sp. ESL0791]